MRKYQSNAKPTIPQVMSRHDNHFDKWSKRWHAIASVQCFQGANPPLEYDAGIAARTRRIFADTYGFDYLGKGTVNR